MAPGATKDWDAASYQRISLPHEEWAEALLARLAPSPGETVLDAGCGTGRVTTKLVDALPDGRVIAVDGSPAMIETVRKVLRPTDDAFVADLTALELPEPVDAVVSSAVFHWIPDHPKLFGRLRAALRPGGRMEAQCGGEGNLDAFRTASGEVAAREPYAALMGRAGFEEPWYYAGVPETEERLRAVGFAPSDVSLQPWEVTPPDPRAFMRTLILKPHMDCLPAELQEPFIDDVLAVTGEPLTIRYVRLNISATAA
jgi:trans-aconitate 2-methyltransferase